MKLAAVYNVFDSEELLEESILSIREQVDLVIVVFQQVSNFGLQHKIDLKKFLKNIKSIDICHEYEVDLSKPCYIHELQKRVIGAKIALDNGCTHFLHMDCDENYDSESFKKCKKIIEDEQIDSSCCEIIDYYKFRNLKIVSNEPLYVPFIHKLQKGITKFGLEMKYPLIVDKTRKTLPVDNFKLFKTDEVVMHHYTWIRKDPLSKLMNSTARHSYDFFIKDIVEEFEKFSINDGICRLATNILVPESVTKRVMIPYGFKKVQTEII